MFRIQKLLRNRYCMGQYLLKLMTRNYKVVIERAGVTKIRWNRWGVKLTLLYYKRLKQQLNANIIFNRYTPHEVSRLWGWGVVYMQIRRNPKYLTGYLLTGQGWKHSLKMVNARKFFYRLSFRSFIFYSVVRGHMLYATYFKRMELTAALLLSQTWGVKIQNFPVHSGTMLYKQPITK
jgi:hypothetical protein